MRKDRTNRDRLRDVRVYVRRRLWTGKEDQTLDQSDEILSMLDRLSTRLDRIESELDSLADSNRSIEAQSLGMADDLDAIRRDIARLEPGVI